MFRTLFPVGGDADLTSVYAPAPPGPRGRRVRLNMLATVDGATSLDGTSGQLGGPPDRIVFSLLRSFADVVLVGAGTARVEHYGPARLDEDVRQARVGRGQTEVPAVAVVTRSGYLDPTTSFFTDAKVRPIIVTVESAEIDPRVAEAADIIRSGESGVDLAGALDQLAGRGLRQVLAEGGPSLNDELLDAGEIDELCLTISPALVGGPSGRVVAGRSPGSRRAYAVASILTADGFLFLRYERSDDSALDRT